MPGAGIANVKAVEAGKADIAFANSVSTVDAINGNPPFDEKATNVCNLATLYPQYFQIVTTEGSGVESLDQLKGQGAHHAADRQHRRGDHRRTSCRRRG